MAYITDKLNWQETKNGITIDCSLDIAIHPSSSNTVFLTIPGVDGSVDGYENKYVRIAEVVQSDHSVGAVRIANPFITSFHWESNIRRALQYIQDNSESITGATTKPTIKVMAHSAGGSILGRIAHEYENISDILLVNPAQSLDSKSLRLGLEKTKAKVTAVFGENDPSLTLAEELATDGHTVVIIKNVDHYFSGDHINTFIELPTQYLFN